MAPTKKAPRKETIEISSSSKTQDRPAKMRSSEPKVAPKMNMFTPATSPKSLVILAFLGLAVGLLYFYKGQFIPVVVNNEPITRIELIKTLETQAGQQLLDGLITEKLIEQEAKAKGIKISQENIDKELASLAKQLAGDKAKAEDLVATTGLPMETLRAQTRLRLMAQGLVGDEAKVTDKEIEEAYQQRVESGLIPEDMDEKEAKAEIKSELENQAISFKLQSLVQDLHSKAKIKQWMKF